MFKLRQVNDRSYKSHTEVLGRGGSLPQCALDKYFKCAPDHEQLARVSKWKTLGFSAGVDKWERDSECCSATRSLVNRDAAMMSVHNRGHDGQT